MGRSKLVLELGDALLDLRRGQPVGEFETQRKNDFVGREMNSQHSVDALDAILLNRQQDESAERDTSAERDEKGTRPVMRQGAADAQSGQQDTDCYKATAPRFDEAHPKSR